MSYDGFFHSLDISFLSHIRLVIVIRVKEPDLILGIVTSILIEEKVHELRKMFGFIVDIPLEVPGEVSESPMG